MAYRIVYGPMPKMVRKENRTQFRLNLMTAVFLLVFALLVRHAWPEGTQMLRSFLLPGEPTITEQALNTLVSDLQTGEAFGDAVVVFCRRIIEHAG